MELKEPNISMYSSRKLKYVYFTILMTGCQFSINWILHFCQETDFLSLNKLNYYVHTGKLKKPP